MIQLSSLVPATVCCCRATPNPLAHRIPGLAFNFSSVRLVSCAGAIFEKNSQLHALEGIFQAPPTFFPFTRKLSVYDSVALAS